METYVSLPNLLAGGLPASALPGLALAAHRGKHTRITQKSTRHARHTKRDLWRDSREGYGRSDRVGGGAAPDSIAAVISRVYLHICLFVWRACVVLFCVARARVLSSVSLRRQTCRQAPSQEIRQAHIRFHKSDMLSTSQNTFPK